MIRITQMKLPITHTEEQLQKKITKTLRLGNTPFTYKIHKQSLMHVIKMIKNLFTPLM